MTEKRIRDLLDKVAAGRMTPATAFRTLGELPFEDLGFAKIDSHRSLRRGVPEVIFGEGKTAAQLIAIGQRVLASNSNLIITRLGEDKARAVRRKLRGLKYHSDARIGTIVKEHVKISGQGVVTVLCAGTSDIPVAEEAALCAELFGNRVARIYDVTTSTDGRLIDPEGLTVEDFGWPDNLMMIHALDLHGCPLVTPRQQPADIWHDLVAFETCVRLAADRAAR